VNETRSFVFEHHGIRGGIVRLRETWLQIIAQHGYPGEVRALLGEAVAATVLLGASLKDKPRISIQAQGDGAVRLLVTQCSSQLSVRGMAQWRDDAPRAPLLGSGRLSVNIDTGHTNGFYQGIVPLAGNRLSECLEAYFDRSEQLPTRLFLFSTTQSASGIVLQMLPGSEDFRIFEDASALASGLTGQDLVETACEELLPRTFPDYTIRLFKSRAVTHDCRCTPEHLANIARLLGSDELESLLEELGHVELTCEFCNRNFQYSREDVSAILRGESPQTYLH
jgi:molecular chaperone Hsp33